MKENKENKEINLSKLNKGERILLFLNEINNNKNMSRDLIKDLYLKKYKLSERSNNINIRVLERFLGSYSNYDLEKNEEIKRNLNESLMKCSINYKDLINSMLIVKEKIKRSNRIREREINIVI